MTSVFSWQNSISLCPASFCTPQPNLPVTPGIPRFPTFAFQFPIIKRTSFIGCYFQNVLQVFIELFKFNFSVLLVEAQTWITAILNGLPWKQTEIILSFLRLHPSTAFWTLLLTMRATPFLLRDSCPQQQIYLSSELNSPLQSILVR